MMGDNWSIQSASSAELGNIPWNKHPLPQVSGNPLCKHEMMQMELPEAGRVATAGGKSR